MAPKGGRGNPGQHRSTASSLDSLEIFVVPDPDSGYSYYPTNEDHTSCSIDDIQEQVRTALLGIPYPVLDSHYRHMEAQKASRSIEIAKIENTNLFSFRHENVQIKVTYRDKLVVGKISSHCIVMASKVWANLIFHYRAKHRAGIRNHKLKWRAAQP
jgi:hypothetical protein